MKRVLILLSILSFSYFGKSQGISNFGVPTSTVNAKGSFLVDSLFVLPLRDTVFPPSYNASLRKTGAMVVKGTNIYYYNSSNWVAFSTGTIDTTSLSNRINARVKYSDSLTIYVTPSQLSDSLTTVTGTIPNLWQVTAQGDSTTRIVVDTLEPRTSAGLHIHNQSHQDIMIMGAGGGQNLTIYAPTNWALLPNLSTTDTVLTTNGSGTIQKVGIGSVYLKKADSATAYVTPSRLRDSTTVLRGLIPTVPTIYYQTMKRNGIPYTQQPTLNFSTQFGVADNAGNTSTDISVSAIAQSVVTGLQDSLNTRVRYTDTSAILGNYAYKDGSNATGTWNNNANTATKWLNARTLAITGDLTYNSGSFDGSSNVTSAGTLATVNSNVGSFGSATQTPTFTVNGKGLITAASNNSIQIAESQVTNLTSDLALKAPLANPTFTGTVTIPTPFTLGATSVTSTGTQLNYLSSATGTTGTTSTNLVFSTSPTLVTPNLGTPSTLVGTNITGTASGLTAGNVTTNANLTGVVTSVGNATSFATSPAFTGDVTATNTTDITLASESALRVGGASNSTNITLGEYSSVLGIQGRNNGASANLFLQPLGGGVSIGDGSITGNRAFAVNNTGSGTGDYASIEIRNGSAGTDALRLYTTSTGFTPSGSNGQDAVAITSGTGLSGGMSIGTLANATFRVFSNNAERWVLDGSGNTIITGKFTSSGGGIGYSTGAGGTVNQGTSRTTGVTLNKLCGNITMFSSAVAINGVSTFTLTNSFIEATDFVLVQHISATNGGAWGISVVAGAGSCTITVRNNTTASITEATPLRFSIIKGVTN